MAGPGISRLEFVGQKARLFTFLCLIAVRVVIEAKGRDFLLSGSWSGRVAREVVVVVVVRISRVVVVVVVVAVAALPVIASTRLRTAVVVDSKVLPLTILEPHGVHFRLFEAVVEGGSVGGFGLLLLLLLTRRRTVRARWGAI